MPFPSLFDASVTDQMIDRVNQLTPTTQPLWGQMNVAQMLAHCNVTYEMTFEDKHPKPNGFTRFILKLFVKPTVIGEKPYRKNSPTAPAFKIAEEKNFEAEKKRLIDYLQKTREMGDAAFEQRESLSFGKLSSHEWNAMFYKHLDHHLRQFGV